MEIESQVDLYDSELAEIRKIFHTLNGKYAQRKDSKQNILSLVHEAEDMFRKVGLEISVTTTEPIILAMGQEPPPGTKRGIQFSIDRRITPDFETDFERALWEAKKDYIPDGVAKQFFDRGGTESDKETVVDEGLTEKEYEQK